MVMLISDETPIQVLSMQQTLSSQSTYSRGISRIGDLAQAVLARMGKPAVVPLQNALENTGSGNAKPRILWALSEICDPLSYEVMFQAFQECRNPPIDGFRGSFQDVRAMISFAA